MRNLKTVLLILAACTAGFLFLRLSAPAKSRTAGPAVSHPSGPKPAVEILAVQAEVAQADTNSSAASEVCSECGKVHAGHVCAMYGGGPLMTLTDLPLGNVKSAVEKLPAEAQQHALLQLSRMSFRSSDEASVRVDANGFIYYVCAFTNAGIPAADNIPLAENATTAGETAAAPLVSYASVPVTSPPIYHSKPGSTKVLFLDFNGHDISNTIWNTESGVSVWHCLPFDTDDDSTTFSDTEQLYIREMWERVAEDYAVYDVDVTTEQPAKWTSTTAHALITPTVDANGIPCPHNGYGGIAYVDVFGNKLFSYNRSGCYSPAWINPMSSYSYSAAAEAASHELGHNMGLSHDGTIINGVTNEYYYGHVNGSISWGPIMGAAYGKNVSQWSKGEYYGAHRFEDDLAIIASKVTYRPDDYSNTIAQAASVVISGGVFSVTGIVERTDDSDMFRFTCAGGMLSLTGSTYRCSEGPWGGNADLVMTLYDSGGSMLTSNNPELETKAVVTQTVTGGTYYLKISPTGVGNPTNSVPTGYTSYGSIGPYTIAGYLANIIYTVTFDAQGGSAASPASMIVTNGSTYGTLATTARTGYTFGGWWTETNGAGSQVLSTTTVTITSAQTLYAKWTANNYTLTVNSGSGSGAYIIAQQVIITANAPVHGMTFDQWTGDTTYVDNVTFTNAIVTMPAQDIALSATYKDITYTLTVYGGTGDGNYTNGAQVVIAADAPVEGQIFDQWIGDIAYVNNVTYTNALVTMPTNAVTVRATYKAVAVYHLLAASAGTNGAVSPASTNVLAGNSVSFVITASNYYRIATLTTNGTAVTGMSFDNGSATTNFIWSNVQTSGVLAVTFINQVTTNAPAPVPYEWLAHYGLTNYNTDVAADQDSDGLAAWQEYIAGTDPTNASSCLKAAQSARNIITWSAVSGRVYGVHWMTNLMNSFQPLETNIVWPQASYTDTLHGAESRSFYKVKVQLAP